MVREQGSLSFNIVGYTLITCVALACLYPFLLILSGSITAEKEIVTQGFRLIPQTISYEAYRVLFKAPEAILRAYGVSVFVTLVGTTLSMAVVSMAAYVLIRRDFPLRNLFSMYFYFTMIFSGGLVPTYILVVRYLHLKNNIMALILPILVNVWNLFILRSYMRSIPGEVIESARIDGAGDFRIYWQMILPMAIPGIATIGLFQSLTYWNDWVLARLYIENSAYYPLQYVLFNILNTVKDLQQTVATAGVPLPQLPTQSLKLAMAVVATGPMILLFPFVQKYFVKGLTIGAVKG